MGSGGWGKGRTIDIGCEMALLLLPLYILVGLARRVDMRWRWDV